jgi:hypothetical protein
MKEKKDMWISRHLDWSYETQEREFIPSVIYCSSPRACEMNLVELNWFCLEVYDLELRDEYQSLFFSIFLNAGVKQNE